MPRTFYTQSQYDLLIDFLEWYRQRESAEPGIFEFDTNDEIISNFLTETDE